MSPLEIRLTVDGVSIERRVEPRLLLTDFLRGELGLTGTHVGCEHGVCGACNVFVDGELVRGCLMLAVQADGRDVSTIAGLADSSGGLHAAQRALVEQNAFQCGFCTPGVALAIADLVRRGVPASEEELRAELSGNLCRCTGYVGIVAAARRAAELAGEEEGG